MCIEVYIYIHREVQIKYKSVDIEGRFTIHAVIAMFSPFFFI